MALWGRLITPFFLFSAFLILLLVSLSLPIIKSIYLFEVRNNIQNLVQTSTGTSLRFGLWGYCVGAYSFSNGHAKYIHTSECSKPKVGYNVGDAVLNIIGNASLVETLLKGLTVVLVIHPIAAALAFLTFFGSLIYALRPTIPHAAPICTLLIAIIPSVLTTVVFVVDIVAVVIARAKIEAATNNGLTVLWGNAVWMTAGAIAAMWLSVIGLSAVACGCFGMGRARDYRSFAMAQFKQKSKRDPATPPAFTNSNASIN